MTRVSIACNCDVTISLERIVVCAPQCSTEKGDTMETSSDQKRSGITSSSWHRQVYLCSSTMAMVVYISSSSTDFFCFHSVTISYFDILCYPCLVWQEFLFVVFGFVASLSTSFAGHSLCGSRPAMCSYWISTAEQRGEDGRIPEEYGARGESGTQSEKAIYVGEWLTNVCLSKK